MNDGQTRADGEGEFGSLEATFPQGLAAKFAGVHAGDFVVSKTDGAQAAEIAKATGVDFSKAPAIEAGSAHTLRPLRIGLYQRYFGGNIDEGWTRWVLEQFSFPYKNVLDPEIKAGNLNAKFDVIILPDDSAAMMMGDFGNGAGAGARRQEGNEGGGGAQAPREGGPFRVDPSIYPAEFRSGLHAEGVAALKDFVQKGGTVVALGTASLFAVERFGLGITNVTAGKSTKQFWCPGSFHPVCRLRLLTTWPSGTCLR